MLAGQVAGEHGSSSFLEITRPISAILQESDETSRPPDSPYRVQNTFNMSQRYETPRHLCIQFQQLELLHAIFLQPPHDAKTPRMGRSHGCFVWRFQSACRVPHYLPMCMCLKVCSTYCTDVTLCAFPAMNMICKLYLCKLWSTLK